MRPSPLLMTVQAEGRLRNLALTAKEIYIFELYLPAAAIYELREELLGGKVVLFVGDGAACAVLTKGAPKNRLAFSVVHAMWSVSA